MNYVTICYNIQLSFNDKSHKWHWFIKILIHLIIKSNSFYFNVLIIVSQTLVETYTTVKLISQLIIYYDIYI